MRAATVQGGTDTDKANGGGGGRQSHQSKIEAQGGTLILSGEDIVSIVIKRFPMQHRPKALGLGTDSDIGGRAGGSQLGKERRLQSVSAFFYFFLFRRTDERIFCFFASRGAARGFRLEPFPGAFAVLGSGVHLFFLHPASRLLCLWRRQEHSRGGSTVFSDASFSQREKSDESTSFT